MTARLAALAAVLLTGCFHTDAVLTVHADGSATLDETVAVEGLAGLGAWLRLDEGPLPVPEGAQRTALDASEAEGVLVLRATYDVPDVNALIYDPWAALGVVEAMHGFAAWAGGLDTEAPATPLRFARAGDALRVTVPERTVRAADLTRVPGAPESSSFAPPDVTTPEGRAAVDAMLADVPAEYHESFYASLAEQRAATLGAEAALGTAAVRFAVVAGADTTRVIDARAAALLPSARADADAFDRAARTEGFAGPGRHVPSPGDLTVPLR